MIRKGGHKEIRRKRKACELKSKWSKEKELLDKCDGLATAAGGNSNGGENVKQ